jgi:hypothetical protein
MVVKIIDMLFKIHERFTLGDTVKVNGARRRLSSG